MPAGPGEQTSNQKPVDNTVEESKQPVNEVESRQKEINVENEDKSQESLQKHITMTPPPQGNIGTPSSTNSDLAAATQRLMA